jgi:hypothetical protein
VFRSSERRCERKFLGLTQIQFAGQSDIAVRGMIEFIIHLEILMQVRPAIALSYVTTGGSGKRDRGGHREPHALLAGHEDPPSVRNGDVACVAVSTYLDVWGTERGQLQRGEKLFVRAGQPRAL